MPLWDVGHTPLLTPGRGEGMWGNSFFFHLIILSLEDKVQQSHPILECGVCPTAGSP